MSERTDSLAFYCEVKVRPKIKTSGFWRWKKQQAGWLVRTTLYQRFPAEGRSEATSLSMEKWFPFKYRAVQAGEKQAEKWEEQFNSDPGWEMIER